MDAEQTPQAGLDCASDNDARTERILGIMAKETNVDRVLLRPEATIEDLGIASLDMVQAIFAIETAFDIEIPPLAAEAGTEFRTVGDLLSHVLAVLDKARDRAL